jgi:hypothetical protein
MIALGIFTIIAVFAVFEAWQDFEIINNHEEVEHINAWMLRAFVTCYLWGAASIWIGWDAAIYAVASAFLFSAVFRYALNRMRVLDWRYVSQSNFYDLVFMSISWLTMAREWIPPLGSMQLYGRRNYYDNRSGLLPPIGLHWKQMIHRAGTVAYITELTIATACVMWVVLT